MTIDIEERPVDDHPLVPIVGRAVINWSLLHWLIKVFMLRMSGAPEDRAKILIEGIRGESALRQAAEPLARIALADHPDHLSRFLRFLKSVEGLSSYRNSVAHLDFISLTDGRIVKDPLGFRSKTWFDKNASEDLPKQNQKMNDLMREGAELFNELTQLLSWPEKLL